MTEQSPSAEQRASPRPRPRPAQAAEPVVDAATQPVAGDSGKLVPPQTGRGGHRRREARSRGRRVYLALLGAVVIAAVVVAVLIVVRDSDSSSPQSAASAPAGSAVVDDPDVALAFVAGATSDISSVTSYDYRSLDSALSGGSSVTTGAYRSSYRAALTGNLGAQARRLHRVQTFVLISAAIGQISDDGRTANVLMFGTQTVTDDSTGQKPRNTVVTLTATIVRQGPRFLISQLAAGTNAGLPPGSSALAVAAESAREEVSNLLSFRRSNFTADLQRAVQGAANPLRAQVIRQAAATKQSLVRGRYDLTGSVTAVGVVRASGATVVMLVAATGRRVPARGATRVVADGRYQVTVVRVGGQWLTSRVDPITSG